MEEIQEFLDNIQMVENQVKFPTTVEALTPFEKYLIEYALMQERMLDNLMQNE